MQQFDRRGRRIAQRGIVIATSRRDREAQPRPDARAARKDRVPHGGGQIEAGSLGCRRG